MSEVSLAQPRPTDAPETLTSHPWATLVLLSIFMLVNFWDRAAFGFAARPLMRDLRLSPTEFGFLAGAFFWLFSPSALAIGWLADRWSVKWIVGVMALLWAVAQALMASAFRLPLVLLSRLLLGLGEGPAYPVANDAAYRIFSPGSRAMATAVISLGVPLGIASGALVITSFVDGVGWRTTFLFLSVVSLAWSIVWLTSQPSTQSGAAAKEPKKTAVGRAHFNATTIGVMVAAFCVYWVLGIAVNWFPSELQVANGLTLIRTGQFLALAWAIQAIVFPLAARLTRFLRNRGYNAKLVYAVPAAGAVAACGLAFTLASYAASNWIALPLIAIGLWATAVTITCLPPIVAEVTPSSERGTALGIFAGFSSTAGIIAPFVFGRIVEIAGGGAHGYRSALLVSGALLVVAAPAVLLTNPLRRATVTA